MYRDLMMVIRKNHLPNMVRKYTANLNYNPKSNVCHSYSIFFDSIGRRDVVIPQLTY
jgi:hypothetical protein